MEPITRKEKFLAAAGGQSVDLPEPITREETFLKAIAEGGGGGGSDLPDVTAADNGKILKVVSGDWTAEDNDFIVAFTKSNNTWSANKTTADIEEAITNKKHVLGQLDPALITSNTDIHDQIILLPLIGDCGGFPYWDNGYSFGGAIQTSTTTIFMNFNVHTNSPSLVNTVTAYIKETYLEPLIVTYTITGQPSGNVYPLSSNLSLEDMLGAISSGRDVIANLTLGNDNLVARLVSFSSLSRNNPYIGFDAIAHYNGVLTNFHISTYQVSSQDVSDGKIIPLSTAQMSFDSSTNTLAITQ